MLRYQGTIIGRGSAFADDNTALWQAARQAIAEARKRLQIRNDALADQSARELAAAFCISLELASPLMPITPAAFADCDLELQNGLDGLATTMSGRTAAVFPGFMLATGLAPSDALVATISTVSGDPNLAIKINPQGQPPMLAADRGLTYYRFRTAHLAQRDATADPIFLFRGGQVVEQRDLTRAALEKFAASLHARLDGLRIPGTAPVSPLTEPYFSFRDRSSPSADPILDRLIRVLGLAAFAAQPDPALSPEAVAAIRLNVISETPALLEELRSAKDARKLSVLHAAAVAGIARSIARFDRDQCRGLLQTLESTPGGDSLAGSFDPGTGWAKEITESQRAFIAYGLACRASLGEDQPRRDTAAAAVRSIYRDTKPTLLVGQMPWLGWAELILAQGKPDVAASVALRDLRDMVWKHQLTPEDVGADGPDLVGGIVFTSGSNPLPTWQTVRPIAFLATMLGDERLTDRNEQLRDTSKILASLRFMRQLALDDAAAYAAPNPAVALWGIRAGPWDQRQSPEATALTLIAVCETLHSLDQVARAQAAPPPAAGPGN